MNITQISTGIARNHINRQWRLTALPIVPAFTETDRKVMPLPIVWTAPNTNTARDKFFLAAGAAGIGIPLTIRVAINDLPVAKPDARPWGVAAVLPRATVIPRSTAIADAAGRPQNKALPRFVPIRVPVAVAGPGSAGSQGDTRPILVPVAVPRAPAVPARPMQEIKQRAVPVVNQLMRPFNATGEIFDFVGALHKALPPCRRTKSSAMINQRAAARRKGWDKKYKAADISSAQKVLDVIGFLRDIGENPLRKSDQVCGGVKHEGISTNYGAGGGWQPQRDGRMYTANNNAAQEYLARAAVQTFLEASHDLAYGAYGKRAAEVNKLLGLPVGVQMLKRILDTASQR